MSTPALFSNVPDKDFLSFGQGTAFDPKRVADWLSLDKAAVSKISAVAPASVRYDEHAPRAVIERLEEIGTICNLVAKFFDGDQFKTALWFKTSNPLLGDISPRDMVRLGRFARLRKFVINAIVEGQTGSAP